MFKLFCMLTVSVISFVSLFSMRFPECFVAADEARGLQKHIQDEIAHYNIIQPSDMHKETNLQSFDSGRVAMVFSRGCVKADDVWPIRDSCGTRCGENTRHWICCCFLSIGWLSAHAVGNRWS